MTLLLALGAWPAVNAGEAPIATSNNQPLPALRSSKSISYPEAARRIGLEGKVLTAVSIAADGRVVSASVLYSDNEVFEKSAKEWLTGLRFDVPFNWGFSESRFLRYHIGILFCIPPSSLVDIFGVAALPVTISSDRIEGSTIRNPPKPGATGPCVKPAAPPAPGS